jgi:hypothetical protein
MKSFTSFNRKTETNASRAKPKICTPSNETWHRDNNLKMWKRKFVCHEAQLEMFIRNTHIKFWTILGAGFGTPHNRRKAARVLQQNAWAWSLYMNMGHGRTGTGNIGHKGVAVPFAASTCPLQA